MQHHRIIERPILNSSATVFDQSDIFEITKKIRMDPQYPIGVTLQLYITILSTVYRGKCEMAKQQM